MVEAVLADLQSVGARFDALILFWLGEPLLHPRFEELYRMILRRNAEQAVFGQIEVHTNATHLDERMVRGVLNQASTPQVWHFSVDADRPDTYERIKGRDRFELVEKNIARMVAQKGLLAARWPRLVFQFILADRNVDEAAPFRRRWELACKRARLPVRTAAGEVPKGSDAVVFFRQLDCPTAAEQVRQNAVFRTAVASMGLVVPKRVVEEIPPSNLNVCSAFWKSPVIGWDGELTVCTRDSQLANRVGNVRETSFASLWWGDGMAQRRFRVARRDYTGLPPCDTCFIPRSANYSELDGVEIQRQAAWDNAQISNHSEPATPSS
jgi:radical SAM protein with 4Fe4S-binding SPASM domain